MSIVKGTPRESVTDRSPSPRGDNSPPFQQDETLNNILLMLGVIGSAIDKLDSAVKVLELSHMLNMEALHKNASKLSTVLMNVRPMLTVERFGADAQGFEDLFPANTAVVPFAEIMDNSSETAAHTSNINLVADELMDALEHMADDDDDDDDDGVSSEVSTTEAPPTTGDPNPTRYVDDFFDIGDPLIDLI